MTKPVTLSDLAYKELLKMKGEGMSFSDVILKLVERSKNVPDFKKFAGALRTNSEDLESLKSRIMEDRKRNVEGR